MAMNIDTGDDKARRSDLFHVVPSSIEVDWQLNGRTDHPSDEDVKALADDLTANGQIQPVTVRRLASKRVKIVAGYTRLRAALLIEQTNPQFRLQCRVVEVNDEEAFLVNIRENLHRNSTTPIDNATNARRLMENYGYTKGKVAEFFRLSTTAVDNLLSLLSLPQAVRDRISNGTLPQSAALQLVGMEAKEVAAVIKTAEAEAAPASVSPALTPAKPTKGSKPSAGRRKGEKTEVTAVAAAKAAPVKLTGSQIANAARAHGKKVRRTWSDVRGVLVGRDDVVSKAILEYADGGIDEDELTRVLEEAADAMSITSEL